MVHELFSETVRNSYYLQFSFILLRRDLDTIEHKFLFVDVDRVRNNSMAVLDEIMVVE